ncbi:short chain dehydrogenase [Whalleya microplaca]|nr:short chain dehydrogenase [Whalleya microplaca]
MLKKFALITGCGQGGIGHALTEEFVRQGFTVIATLLEHESDEHLQSPQIHMLRLDVTKEADVASFYEKVFKICEGRLDVLVNNAGICYTMTAADTDVRSVEKMFAVNLFGPMRMVHHFHRMIIAAKGIIINIGSIGGISPYVFGASYNASKAALHHWGNTVRVEMQPFGVRVMNVISGEVSTNILKSDVHDGRQLPPDSVYQPIAEVFKAHIHRTPSTMTPAEYAKGVVAKSTAKSPPAWFWHGNSTTIVRLLDALFPRTVFDGMFFKWFSLEKLQNTFVADRG